MRQKCEAVLCFEFNVPKGPKPVVEYCEQRFPMKLKLA